jgi:thioredoxin reductase (NADPH)
VHLLVRSNQLSESMSQYLIARIDAHPRIEIHYVTQIVGLTGTAHLESIDWMDDSSGLRVTNRIRHVFVMAGAAPRTEWLEDSFVLDKKGFIVTGPDLAEYGEFQWPLSRSPLLLETSVPGVFAVGAGCKSRDRR